MSCSMDDVMLSFNKLNLDTEIQNEYKAYLNMCFMYNSSFEDFSFRTVNYLKNCKFQCFEKILHKLLYESQCVVWELCEIVRSAFDEVMLINDKLKMEVLLNIYIKLNPDDCYSILNCNIYDACKSGYTCIVKLFLEAGENPSPVHALTASIEKGQIDVVYLLFQYFKFNKDVINCALTLSDVYKQPEIYKLASNFM